MALEGTFKDFPISDILQLIGLQGKTGVLSLEREGQQLKVFFAEGKVAWAEDTLRDPEMRLGVLLTKSCKLERAQLEEALARQKDTKERLGSILLQMGVVNALELEEALSRQIFETVAQVFRWKEGRYRFSSLRSLDLKERLVNTLAVENLLLDAMRMIDEWPLIESQLPSFESILMVAENREERQPPGRSEEERIVLGLVDGTRTLRDIVENSPLTDFDTCKTVAQYLRSGVLQVRTRVVPESCEIVPVAASASSGKNMIPLALVLAGLLLLAVNLLSARSSLFPLLPFVPLPGKEATLASVYRAQSEVEGWRMALDRFYAQWGRWPHTLEELGEKEVGMRLQEKDPWGNRYRYRREGEGYVLSSPGEDGIDGSDDDIRGGGLFGEPGRATKLRE